MEGLPDPDWVDVDELWQDLPADVITFLALCASGPRRATWTRRAAGILLNRYGYATDGEGRPRTTRGARPAVPTAT